MALRPIAPIDTDRRRIFLGILLLATSLSLVDAKSDSGPIKTVRSTLVSLVSPIQNLVYSTGQPVSNFFADWAEVGSKNEIIKKLRAENAELIAKIQAAPDSNRRLKELDDLLQTAGLGKFKIVPARVMSSGSSSGFGATVLIDAGSIDGVKKDMTVMAGSGMVGRVAEVYKNSSLVVLISDSTSTVGARVAENGKIGFLTGRGSSQGLSLEFVDPTAEVKAGDQLVSYGVSGGIFASGIPLGIVREVKYAGGNSVLSAVVDPFVDLQSLDLVGVVISKPRTDPRDALLPTPTVVPTVTVTVTSKVTSNGIISASPSVSGTE